MQKPHIWGRRKGSFAEEPCLLQCLGRCLQALAPVQRGATLLGCGPELSKCQSAQTGYKTDFYVK